VRERHIKVEDGLGEALKGRERARERCIKVEKMQGKEI
jgi:hypothetical protein